MQSKIAQVEAVAGAYVPDSLTGPDYSTGGITDFSKLNNAINSSGLATSLAGDTKSGERYIIRGPTSVNVTYRNGEKKYILVGAPTSVSSYKLFRIIHPSIPTGNGMVTPLGLDFLVDNWENVESLTGWFSAILFGEFSSQEFMNAILTRAVEAVAHIHAQGFALGEAFPVGSRTPGGDDFATPLNIYIRPKKGIAEFSKDIKDYDLFVLPSVHTARIRPGDQLSWARADGKAGITSHQEDWNLLQASLAVHAEGAIRMGGEAQAMYSDAISKLQSLIMSAGNLEGKIKPSYPAETKVSPGTTAEENDLKQWHSFLQAFPGLNQNIDYYFHLLEMIMTVLPVPELAVSLRESPELKVSDANGWYTALVRAYRTGMFQRKIKYLRSPLSYYLETSEELAQVFAFFNQTPLNLNKYNDYYEKFLGRVPGSRSKPVDLGQQFLLMSATTTTAASTAPPGSPRRTVVAPVAAATAGMAALSLETKKAAGQRITPSKGGAWDIKTNLAEHKGTVSLNGILFYIDELMLAVAGSKLAQFALGIYGKPEYELKRQYGTTEMLIAPKPVMIEVDEKGHPIMDEVDPGNPKGELKPNGKKGTGKMEEFWIGGFQINGPPPRPIPYLLPQGLASVDDSIHLKKLLDGTVSPSSFYATASDALLTLTYSPNSFIGMYNDSAEFRAAADAAYFQGRPLMEQVLRLKNYPAIQDAARSMVDARAKRTKMASVDDFVEQSLGTPLA